MSDELMCVCGHGADEHHGVWYVGGAHTLDECEYYGSNELGGKMPVHDDGAACPAAGVWFRREDDGVWRATDGTGRTTEEVRCDRDHTWVDHCHYFRRQEETK